MDSDQVDKSLTRSSGQAQIEKAQLLSKASTKGVV